MAAEGGWKNADDNMRMQNAEDKTRLKK